MDITSISFVTLEGLKEFLTKCKETFALKEELEEMVRNLYIKPGDVIEIPSAAQWGGVCTGGFLTNAAKDVSFVIPLNRPINASKVTISNAVLSVRQNGYIFGTGAETTPVPSTAQITATIPANTFIRVVIQFASALSATNNTPVGITFSGTLTFA